MTTLLAATTLAFLAAAVSLLGCSKAKPADYRAPASTVAARLRTVPKASSVASSPASQPLPTAPKANAVLRRCDQLSLTAEKAPLGPDGLDVRHYAFDAGSQQQRLLRVLATHPDSAGGDPDFNASNSTLFDAIPSYFVFPPGLPVASRYRLNPSQGATLYSVIGRFSGREIDHYEWYRVQYGKEDDPSTIEGELRKERRETWPEFCVVSWCFVPDPFPDRDWPLEQKAEIRAAYAKHVSRMLSEGAKLCKGLAHYKASQHIETAFPRRADTVPR